jgi:hypothetical protein
MRRNVQSATEVTTLHLQALVAVGSSAAASCRGCLLLFGRVVCGFCVRVFGQSVEAANRV